MNKRIKGSLILLLTAVLWGFGFAAQSAGGDAVGALAFNALRLITATVGMTPAAAIAMRKRYGGMPKGAALKRTLAGGLISGALLAIATNMQQFGVQLTGSAGKSGFITALYIIFLPFFGIITGRRPRWTVWPCVAVAVLGLWFICGAGDLSHFGTGELLLVLCAICYAAQITAVDKTLTPDVDGVVLSFVQFAVASVLSFIPLAISGFPSGESLGAALPYLLYAGLVSGAVGFTLQIIGQRDCPPVAAGLIMSLEAVFSAVGGFILLGQKLTHTEILGCAILFAAVTAAQIPVKSKNIKIPEGESEK